MRREGRGKRATSATYFLKKAEEPKGKLRHNLGGERNLRCLETGQAGGNMGEKGPAVRLEVPLKPTRGHP